MIPPTDLLDFGALCLGESQWSSPGSLCPSLWFPNSAPLIAASLSRIVAVLDGLRFFAIPRMEVPFGLGLPRHLPIPRYPRGSISPQLAPSSIQVTSPHPTLPANAARWRAGARPLWLLCATPAGLRSPAIGGGSSYPWIQLYTFPSPIQVTRRRIFEQLFPVHGTPSHGGGSAHSDDRANQTTNIIRSCPT